MKKVNIIGTNITPKQWSNLILELNIIRKQWAPYAKFEIQGPGVSKIIKNGTNGINTGFLAIMAWHRCTRRARPFLFF